MLSHSDRGEASSEASDADRRFMAAAIRLSRRHLGRTGTNPAVGTLIVTPDGRIVGRGVTAPGGRPHAEPQALAEAGEQARGATAYVTLEPCSHHGRTPPCAEALIAAGIARVVCATSDPDNRVAGRGYALLENAGIALTKNVLADQAIDVMAGYLSRTFRHRSHVTLKLAVSVDGMIGRRGEGQVSITGDVSRAHLHMQRAQMDGIAIGVGTALADNPELTCRLPGLEEHSPVRVVLDGEGRLPLTSRLVKTAPAIPLIVATVLEEAGARAAALRANGALILGAERVDGRLALPEIMEDLAARGLGSLMVEGGAALAQSLLSDGLVDRIWLYTGTAEIGAGGISSPLTAETIPQDYRLTDTRMLGQDKFEEWVRES
ncbi:bifunctional diaminohydroxyphosphoribosylaminopyrimidine deaminase/5-amino-6-(5-phosphoribosylamino)uracil reductase RibD [Notoacmeibacter sp. MSK16QG-6]|uniref:bifunctional diaminohydroxyphosphoribosylaminopyrimidine deaminase/5-amino-6-(5-phosphoribosylamino)uracil reductase RibD n=1 Tax=Notoacmeibacter sp. MSK16QG-6 TaxID=2957982 RepID=UPI00209C78D9|nr:bifunctional diaminohydroxyphosphoribosylaminopyrimidine deaminase/5-amino-6-(5-phosphoribosylamino)uracil reductase RibD [Notoacmeibacter sp. MSK16QG-6]MCP1198458.1 bifunctional diaminohydroxyphosphoribosylaminopyrimidine deaminase/5-amino-6-(5-phosphoribosylamino)uracil reductase RibD [Notoacmeibacter sp. MSK16QG-6]